MYLIDFFNRIVRKANVSVLIYLIFNIFILGAIVSLLSSVTYLEGLLIGGILYIISLVIALSPIGEWILRVQTGCKKITRIEQLNFLDPIFKEVYDKAKKLDSSIPDGIQLYINNDKSANAFATGRKTICITEGLLHVPEELIKATLGHEFGHLAHKDTDLILVVLVGNLIISTIVLAIRVIINFLHLIFSMGTMAIGGSEGAFATAINNLYHFLITAFVVGFMWIWTKIGIILVMKSSRVNEFEADEFSFYLGYGEELCIFLNAISCDGKKGVFANLASSHPNKDDRITKLQNLGVTFRVSYDK